MDIKLIRLELYFKNTKSPPSVWKIVYVNKKTKLILATEEVIIDTVKVIWSTTKVIYATE